MQTLSVIIDWCQINSAANIQAQIGSLYLQDKIQTQIVSVYVS